VNLSEYDDTLMPTARLVGSWMRCTCTSASIHLWDTCPRRVRESVAHTTDCIEAYSLKIGNFVSNFRGEIHTLNYVA